MARTRDEDSGEFAESVSDGDLLHFFDRSERGFFASTEIAGSFDLDRSTAHRRLSQLADDGELERVDVGGRTVLWRRPRDVVVLLEEEDGYAVLDATTGIASQGDTRPEALRMLADALEATENPDAISPSAVFDELGVDRDELGQDPPWEE